LAIVALAYLFPTQTEAQDRMRGFQTPMGLSASDIDALAALNANVVRYQLHWADFNAADASNAVSYRAWLLSALDAFDQELPLFTAKNIKVILNLHTPPGAFTRRDAQATHRVFVEEWAQTEFLAAWELITLRYSGNSNIYGFDLLNEPAQYSKSVPAGLRDWYSLAVESVSRIRAIDPARKIIISPRYGNPSLLKTFKPLPFENLIYTVHFYKPWKFIHQGLFKIKIKQLYPNKKENKRYLAKALSPVIKFQKKHKTRVYVGEFSVARWAPKGSGARYLKDLIKLFEKHKMDWTYHAFREAHVWSLECGSNPNDLSASPVPTDRMKVVSKFLAKN